MNRPLRSSFGNHGTLTTWRPRNVRVPGRGFLLLGLLAVVGAGNLLPARAWDPLEQVDQALHVETAEGKVRADVSGLFDLEGYYIDQRPPGMLFGNDSFVNPRLALFLDARLGTHLYAFVQGRIDRGFDPRAKVRDARADEYLLRYTPFDDARLQVQVGKFATVFGQWVKRHDTWHNPFINAPLPYENFLVIGDRALAGSPQRMLARRNVPENKPAWLPAIWGPSYASGAAVLGRLEGWDYALELKNASLSSRPAVWDGADLGWDHPTVTGRVGYQPNPTWNFGASGSFGAYLLPGTPGLPASKGIGDFLQIGVGPDVSFAWRRWQVWTEATAWRFEVPYVGNADTVTWFLEVKHKLTPHLFAAARWNQQLFDRIPNGLGGQERWDRDIWRVDGALGYRVTRHMQAKLQYSYCHQDGPFQQGEQLVAAQVTLKF